MTLATLSRSKLGTSIEGDDTFNVPTDWCAGYPLRECETGELSAYRVEHPVGNSVVKYNSICYFVSTEECGCRTEDIITPDSLHETCADCEGHPGPPDCPSCIECNYNNDLLPCCWSNNSVMRVDWSFSSSAIGITADTPAQTAHLKCGCAVLLGGSHVLRYAGTLPLSQLHVWTPTGNRADQAPGYTENLYTGDTVSCAAYDGSDFTCEYAATLQIWANCATQDDGIEWTFQRGLVRTNGNQSLCPNPQITTDSEHFGSCAGFSFDEEPFAGSQANCHHDESGPLATASAIAYFLYNGCHHVVGSGCENIAADC